MALYKYITEDPLGGGENNLYLSERNIYGSSRIGQEKIGEILASSNPNEVNINIATQNSIGDKFFEMSNHLGNVLEVVTDRKLPVPDDNGNIDYFLADVVSYSDYYPYGMQMPKRNGSTGEYRYGYNTQERVDEIAGKGNHYTAPYWEYDPRVVHRWNRDPMAFKYPWQSPYVINNNNPIWFHDPLGDEFDPASQEVVDEHKEFTRNEINTLENDLMFLNSLNSALGNNYEGMDPFNEVMAEINRVEEALAELNDALVEITILENSDQMYSVVQMTSKTKEGFTGVTKYENGIVVAYYSDNSTLAHELKHLYQFENKQISFAPEGGPGYLYDATDEIEAYTRQSYYNGDISIRKMSADDVRNLHENYQDLKDGPINANILIKEIFKGSQYLEDVGFKIMNMTFETWNQTRKVDIIKQ